MVTAPQSLMTSIWPFLIVRDVKETVAFYRDRLGFEATYLAPEGNPFFAILSREGAQLMVKAVAEDVPPLPNSERHPWAPWDAYVCSPEPDALAAELEGRGIQFDRPLMDNEDGLRGFTVRDPNGYVLFFGRPRE